MTRRSGEAEGPGASDTIPGVVAAKAPVPTPHSRRQRRRRLNPPRVCERISSHPTPTTSDRLSANPTPARIDPALPPVPSPR